MVQDGRDLLHAAAISGNEELVHMLVEDYTLAPCFSTVNTSLYCHIFTPCTVEPLCVYIVYTIRTQPAVLHREMSLMHGPILYTVLCMWLVQQTVSSIERRPFIQSALYKDIPQ